LDIGTNFDTPELVTPQEDHYLVDPKQIAASRWQVDSYDIPKGARRTQILFMKTSRSAEFSLQVSLAKIEIGPRVKIQLLKDIESSYRLVGKHSYSAFIPTNGLGYCWQSA
jgi:hypothetical protein